jgi:hypothetical protein
MWFCQSRTSLLGTSLNEHRIHEEYDCDSSNSHDNPLIQGVLFLWHEIFSILFCASAFASAHVMSPLIFTVKNYYFLGPSEEKFMNGTPFNKIKSTALGLAGTTLARVELASEEGRLKTKFQALGQKLYKAVQGDLLGTIKNDPSVVELIGDIEETQRRIADLESKIGGGNR